MLFSLHWEHLYIKQSAKKALCYWKHYIAKFMCSSQLMKEVGEYVFLASFFIAVTHAFKSVLFSVIYCKNTFNINNIEYVTVLPKNRLQPKQTNKSNR